jgi:hypothetical protein
MSVLIGPLQVQNGSINSVLRIIFFFNFHDSLPVKIHGHVQISEIVRCVCTDHEVAPSWDTYSIVVESLGINPTEGPAL